MVNGAPFESELRIILATNVVGYGSTSYLIGIGVKMPSAGNRRINIRAVVAVLSEVLRQVALKMERELLIRNANKNKRREARAIDITAVKDKPREKTVTATSIGKGYKKRSETVMSANKLATKNCLGVIGEVRIKLCSYSNTVTPLYVDNRLRAINPARTADKSLMKTAKSDVLFMI